MSWPQTIGLSATGVGTNQYLPTTIGWGTDGIYTGVIVKNVRAIPMISEIQIEMGSGLTATQVIINDGDQIELTVVDDRSITFPQPGTPITLFNPQPNGLSATSEAYMMVNNNLDVARKSESERTLLAKKYRLLTPTQM